VRCAAERLQRPTARNVAPVAEAARRAAMGAHTYVRPGTAACLANGTQPPPCLSTEIDRKDASHAPHAPSASHRPSRPGAACLPAGAGVVPRLVLEPARLRAQPVSAALPQALSRARIVRGGGARRTGGRSGAARPHAHEGVARHPPQRRRMVAAGAVVMNVWPP
jgi:hypothetical protein